MYDIIRKGEKYMLSDASNRSQGGKLVSLQDEIDDELLKWLNEAYFLKNKNAFSFSPSSKP